MRPAKTQISLSIRPLWSESSLSAWRKRGSLANQCAQVKTPIRLGECSSWSESSLGAHVILLVCHAAALFRCGRTDDRADSALYQKKKKKKSIWFVFDKNNDPNHDWVLTFYVPLTIRPWTRVSSGGLEERRIELKRFVSRLCPYLCFSTVVP